MNQEKKINKILSYFQVLAFGLILVFSPCSVRNAIQDSLNLEKTDVTNKSKSINNFEELCLEISLEVDGETPSEIINSTPEIPTFLNEKNQVSTVFCNFDQQLGLGHYQSPSVVKDKTPLYLLHQQFKIYLTKV